MDRIEEKLYPHAEYLWKLTRPIVRLSFLKAKDMYREYPIIEVTSFVY